MSTQVNSLQAGIKYYFPADMRRPTTPSKELVEGMKAVVDVMNRAPYVEYRRTGGYGLGYFDVNPQGTQLLQGKGMVIAGAPDERLTQVYQAIAVDPVLQTGKLGPAVDPAQEILNFLRGTIAATEAAKL